MQTLRDGNFRCQPGFLMGFLVPGIAVKLCFFFPVSFHSFFWSNPKQVHIHPSIHPSIYCFGHNVFLSLEIFFAYPCRSQILVRYSFSQDFVIFLQPFCWRFYVHPCSIFYFIIILFNFTSSNYPLFNYYYYYSFHVSLWCPAAFFSWMGSNGGPQR